ncbi:MAG TPA: M20 family peptidase [Burkholderiaceae bacterium]|nr:M20 family peptidase [Burkholderiaceae bacterium]
MIKRLLVAIALLLLALVAAVAFNTVRLRSRQLDPPPGPPLALDEAAAAERLGEAIRYRTVSDRHDETVNAEQFLALQEHLRKAYPRVHSSLRLEHVGGLSLLFTWPGTDPSLEPILLMAHQDVVPIAPGTDADWKEPPFSGAVKNGFVWGRGSWDDKGNLIAQLEAVERLLADGFAPRRPVMLAFGADEEVGGARGAAQIARLLAQRGVKFQFILDEGLLITQGLMPGLRAPLALIGVAEKGYASVVLKVRAAPGHSSMPPPPGSSAIGKASATLVRIEQQQFPAEIRGVAQKMFDTLAPEMPPLQRVTLANLWLFGPLVRRQLEDVPSANAMLRTTTALTLFNAGNAENVLPGQAEAVVNFRILPGDSIESALRHVKEIAGQDGTEISLLGAGSEPSAIASIFGPQYELMNRTVRELFPGTLVAPGLMIGATDSTHFRALSEHIYRFSPVRAGPADLPRFHGTNERISIDNLGDLIRFYHRLLQQGAR